MKHSAGALLSYIKLDRSSRKGVGVQLYMALRDIILSGGLRAGDRLPATRILARELGVSRTTVIGLHRTPRCRRHAGVTGWRGHLCQRCA